MRLGRQARVGAGVAAATVLGAALIGGGAVLLRRNTRLSGTPAELRLLSAASAQSPPAAAPQPAVDLWRRTLRAQNTPLRAQVVITRWSGKASSAGSAGGAESVVSLTLVEGTGGRYRLTYTAPANVRGRVVVGDGKTIWQYEPSKQIVLRRTAPPPDAALPSPLALSSATVSGRVPRIEAGAATVAGRATQVLALRDLDGRVRERRWVDTRTGRTLRLEEYARGGARERRVELTRVVFPPVIAAEAFRPDFPPSARVLAASSRRSKNVAAEARRLHLPTEASGYRLRSVVHLPADALGFADCGDHLIYSNGLRAVSLFITPAVSAPALKPAAGWRAVRIAEAIPGFVQEDAQGRVAVAWLGAGQRYVAVARLSAGELLPIARALARGVASSTR